MPPTTTVVGGPAAGRGARGPGAGVRVNQRPPLAGAAVAGQAAPRRMSRLKAFAAFTLTLSAGVVASAYTKNQHHFYSAGVHLAQSGASMLALVNLLGLVTVLIGRAVQMVVFGPLRGIEVEHLYERSWIAVTELLLAMTTFHNEFDARFAVYFTVLLLLKAFHWITGDRVEIMEQLPTSPFLSHFRLQGFMLVMLVIDAFLFKICAQSYSGSGPFVMLLFCFEYTILASTMVTTITKYFVHLYDAQRHEHAWEHKSTVLFYVDLLHDLFKLINYAAFFALILTHHGLPLHVLRDLYLTLRSFLLKVRDLVRYRRATQNMQTRYPDATAADLERASDRTCIICREDMYAADEERPVGDAHPHHPHGAAPATPAAVPGAAAPDGTGDPAGVHAVPRIPPSRSQVPKKLPCGHIFHFGCMRSWLERQQSCPTCRRALFTAAPAAAAATPAPGGAAPPAAAAGDAAPVGAQPPNIPVPPQVVPAAVPAVPVARAMPPQPLPLPLPLPQQPAAAPPVPHSPTFQTQPTPTTPVGAPTPATGVAPPATGTSPLSDPLTAAILADLLSAIPPPPPPPPMRQRTLTARNTGGLSDTTALLGAMLPSGAAMDALLRAADADVSATGGSVPAVELGALAAAARDRTALERQARALARVQRHVAAALVGLTQMISVLPDDEADGDTEDSDDGAARGAGIGVGPPVAAGVAAAAAAATAGWARGTGNSGAGDAGRWSGVSATGSSSSDGGTHDYEDEDDDDEEDEDEVEEEDVPLDPRAAAARAAALRYARTAESSPLPSSPPPLSGRSPSLD